MSKQIKHLISTQDWSRSELDQLLERAARLRTIYKTGGSCDTLLKKTLFMLLFNSSTRTRAACESAMTNLGGHAQYIGAESTRLSDGEAPRDIARVYSRYGHGIAVRPECEDENHRYGKAHKMLREMAAYSTVPVISMGDEMYHPCQGLADVLTVKDLWPNPAGKRFVILWSYSSRLRDTSSVQEDALMMTRYGLHVTVCHPPGFGLDPAVLQMAMDNAGTSGGRLTVSHDPSSALADADVVFPRNWRAIEKSGWGRVPVSKSEERPLHEHHRDWILDSCRAACLPPSAKIMHVLPVFRGEEATDEVIDSDRSVIFDQVENKLYAQMAVLETLLS